MIWTEPQLIGWITALVLAAWLPPKRAQSSVISVVGLAFLGASDPLSLAALAALGCLAFILSRGGSARSWRVVVVVLVTASTVVFFKLGVRLGDETSRVYVPLGMSYYGLRIIHYNLEAYKGLQPKHTPLDFARYLSFFPTVIAGPINRFAPFCRDGQRRRWDNGMFAVGLERMLYGFVKIVVLGNYVVEYVAASWLASQPAGNAWMIAYATCLFYGANLYLQFSGYSDVAIGLARVVGYRIEENFNWPFLALNINDFWHRWHITLSSWCRDYVFTPVGIVSRSAYLGVVASMLVLGVWHEVSVRYALWGLFHGVGIAVWQLWKRWQPAQLVWPEFTRPIRIGLAWAVTINYVIVSFAFTSTNNLSDAWAMILTLVSFGRANGV